MARPADPLQPYDPENSGAIHKNGGIVAGETCALVHSEAAPHGVPVPIVELPVDPVVMGDALLGAGYSALPDDQEVSVGMRRRTHPPAGIGYLVPRCFEMSAQEGGTDRFTMAIIALGVDPVGVDPVGLDPGLNIPPLLVPGDESGNRLILVLFDGQAHRVDQAEFAAVQVCGDQVLGCSPVEVLYRGLHPGLDLRGCILRAGPNPGQKNESGDAHRQDLPEHLYFSSQYYADDCCK